MGLFSSECSNCGSKEHASSTCPHGLFSSKCSHCGSKDHASGDCPHGLFSSKCSHCGSKDHASGDCPHGIFSSKCSHCGSKNHASGNCPHGIFSSKCSNCGSKNHASGDCPQGLFSSSRSSSSNKKSFFNDTSILGISIKLGLIAFAIAIALTILTIAFLLAPIGLLVWYLINKRKNRWLAISGILIGLYLTYDTFSNGLITGNMMKMQASEGIYISLVYFIITVIISALLFDKYATENMSLNLNGNFFIKRNRIERRKIIIGIVIAIIVLYAIFI
ncbi:hypothetical protein IMCC3317_39770 [Kordia antarctica]|uniref:CCHC-type domain-containing protein n=1 Tax=Kordia antarctica TaxID=1218801 RepID=A0A7L4ZPE0_9FLAO|nr:hypothetical protein [Kordia antarctica]QHI38583.1 hypothetical protein IMCC3317_39770 [Kordia antarctica]